MKVIQSILISLTLLSASVIGKSLEATSQDVFTSVETQLNTLKQNNELNTLSITRVVENTILPSIDKKFFAYKVLGKNLTKANAEQKQEFIDVLTQRLVQNYVTSLAQFEGESLHFGDVRYSESRKTAVANMLLNRKKNNVAIQTKWRYSKQSEQWLMYDLIVEGISLLQTKQKELAPLLTKSNMSTVIQKLKMT